jgi:hypothetical protein
MVVALLGACTILATEENRNNGKYDIKKTDRGQETSRNEKTINNMLRKIHRQIIDGGVNPPNLEDLIKECLQFLVLEFGPPKYSDHVVLVVTSDPASHGKMIWEGNTSRKIIIKDFNLFASELHILVHELFHAFYQSNNFIKANPDFIKEGLAVYAEYKYKFKNKNNEEILNILKYRLRAFEANIIDKSIDFDSPFYKTNLVEYYYLLSGILFFSQDSNSIHDKISKMIDLPPKGNQKDFMQLAKRYGLEIDEEIFGGIKGKPKKTKKKLDYVQVASVKSARLANAKKTSKCIKNEGYDSVVLDQADNLLILIGPFSSKMDAEKVKSTIIADKLHEVCGSADNPYVHTIENQKFSEIYNFKANSN